MLKQSKRRLSRVKNLAVICTLIAIVLSISTYAWFIGMQTVHVSSFDVEIQVTDSLLLSLNGSTWDNTVSISKDTLTAVSYDGHTNSWGGDGLIPVSSVGEMDSVASRMKLFEKASLTATPGGYRLLASRVDNYTDPSALEPDGYVVFDLFIKNFSGTQYIEVLNELDEEAIYLTTDSEVVVGAAGVADTGIENSVRVAFAQIGRVIGTTTTAETITGITCSTAGSVTGICRTAQIWEPNDTDHNANAISWYDTSCVKRIAEDVTDPASYLGECGTVIDGTAYATYAIRDEITSADNVDIYDGAAYNEYDHGWLEGEELLYAYPYFTDTMKLLTGTNRPSFMTLAPNSITKVRVYIYIEGQDIDNYDFSMIGKQIAVNFGFTKQRFVETDINYTGPTIDVMAPVITLLGDNPYTVTQGSEYTDPGATALDNIDGDVTLNIVADISDVDTSTLGSYTVTYEVTDAAGNTATATRTVIVEAE